MARAVADLRESRARVDVEDAVGVERCAAAQAGAGTGRVVRGPKDRGYRLGPIAGAQEHRHHQGDPVLVFGRDLEVGSVQRHGQVERTIGVRFFQEGRQVGQRRPAIERPGVARKAGILLRLGSHRKGAVRGVKIVRRDAKLRRLLTHEVRRPLSRAACTAGSNSANSSPTIAITTSSSTKVKPARSRRTLVS